MPLIVSDRRDIEKERETEEERRIGGEMRREETREKRQSEREREIGVFDDEC